MKDNFFRGTEMMGVASPTPDNTLFQSLAKVYASNHGNMAKGQHCGDELFPDGITNGAHWYNVAGV
jgi:hypothetical protein